VQLKAAIGSFFFEFSKFEMPFVGMALRSLSKDCVFVEQAETLLNLEARLTLLERMAFARGVPPDLTAELNTLLSRARKLSEQRDEIARNLVLADLDSVKPHLGASPRLKGPKIRNADYARLAEVKALWMPSVAQIHTYVTEAIELQETTRAIAEKFDQHLLADVPSDTGNS
jgi:hypothetical protein